MKGVNTLFATVLLTGYSPVAPGTVGSLVALVLIVPLAKCAPEIWIAIIVSLTAIGIYTATHAEAVYGHDASQINIDEFVGMCIALFALPKTLVVVSAAFFLFRLFDIIKPFFIDRLQRLPKGWGVMADDILAGLYTNVLLQIAVRVLKLGH